MTFYVIAIVTFTLSLVYSHHLRNMPVCKSNQMFYLENEGQGGEKREMCQSIEMFDSIFVIFSRILTIHLCRRMHTYNGRHGC